MTAEGEHELKAALLREETRGGHWRGDFPERDDGRFLGHVVHVRGEAPRLVGLAGGATAGSR